MKAQRFAKKRLTLEILESRVVPSGAAKSLLASPTVATTSANWSGYAIETSLSSPQVGVVTAVSGDWTVPAVSGTGTGYSSVWVGIDGYSSPTVEQIGTEQDLSRGTAVYSAWYEIYPKEAEIPISGLTVQPGDKIAASVNYAGASSFTMSITDTPKNGGGVEHYTISQTEPGAQRSSAEWIVEAPSSGGILPLADFGSATFSGASATINGAVGPIDSSAGANTSIDMVSGRTTEAATGALTDSTTPATSTFTVTYVAATTPTPACADPRANAPTATIAS